MTVRYFKDTEERVFGFDTSNPEQLPLIEKAVADGYVEITGSWPPAPAAATAAQNEAKAKALLVSTDWSQLADVAQTLANKTAFDAYRAELRSIATAPVAGDLVWPVCPTAVWS